MGGFCKGLRYNSRQYKAPPTIPAKRAIAYKKHTRLYEARTFHFFSFTLACLRDDGIRQH